MSQRLGWGVTAGPVWIYELALAVLMATGTYVAIIKVREGHAEMTRAESVLATPTDVTYEELRDEKNISNRHLRLTEFQAGRLHAWRAGTVGVESNQAAVPLFPTDVPWGDDGASARWVAVLHEVGDAGSVRRRTEQTSLTGVLQDQCDLPEEMLDELQSKYPALDLAACRALHVDAPLPTIAHGSMLVRYGYFFAAVTSLINLIIALHIAGVYGRSERAHLRIASNELDAHAIHQAMLASLLGNELTEDVARQLDFRPTPTGFVARHGEHFVAYDDEQVTGVRMLEEVLHYRGDRAMVRRSLDLRVECDGLERKVRGEVDSMADETDPIGLLYVRLLGTLETTSWKRLLQGIPVRGQRWSLQEELLTLDDVGTFPWSDIHRVAWQDGKLCLWYDRDQRPLASLGESEDNVVLLSQLLKRVLAERPQSAALS